MNNYDLLVSLLKEKVKNPDKITLEASMNDLGIDSLDLVDVVLQAETELGVTFEDDELLDLRIVKDVVDLLDRKSK